MTSGGRGSKGGYIALFIRCVYFPPVGVLSYLYFNREDKKAK